jgi:hypothetical protein
MALFQAAKELKAEKAQQAARIAELEAQIATVAPAVDAQPIAWFIADDNGEVYRSTGYEHERDQWRAVGHEVFPLYASAQSEGSRKLDAPAQVAGTVFRSGISWETVIKAAQRNYRYRNDPATNDYPDTFTLEQIQAMDKIIPQGDREFVGLKDYQALANEFATLSQKESGE